MIFLEFMKDSSQSKHNCMKTFNVRHDAKLYRVSQGVTGEWKIISFLNDTKLYDEERNKLS